MDAEKGPPSLIRDLLERTIEQGSTVYYDGKKVVVQIILSAGEVQIRHEDGTFSVVGANLLSQAPPPPTATLVGMAGDETPSKERVEEAQRRSDCIRDLIHNPIGRKQKLVARSKVSGYAVSTLYDWIKIYEKDNIPVTDISFLLPPIPHGGRGGCRFGILTKQFIDAGIELYLDPKRPTVAKIVKLVDQECKKYNEGVRERNKVLLATHVKPTLEEEIEEPSHGAIRYQLQIKLDKLGPAEVARRRGLLHEAQQYEINRPSTIVANTPLELVELDHKIFKVMLVDEVTAQYTQRPYLTVAIDVYSRALTGYYISLDPTGAFTTGICIANTLLPKDEWVRTLQTDPRFKDMNPDIIWPVWGVGNGGHQRQGEKESCEEG